MARRADVGVLSEDTAREARMIQIRINWPFNAHRAFIVLRSPGEIQKVSISGQEIRIAKDNASFIYNAPPQEEIELSIELAGEESLDIEAVCRLLFMPVLPGFSYKPRPAHMMAGHMMGQVSDCTLIRSVTTLTPDPKTNP